MNNFPRYKTILFSIVAVGIVFFCLEATARVVLSFKNNSFAYSLYGFRDIKQKQLLRRFEGKNGEIAYYKGTPSGDKTNPVNSLGFRGPEIYGKKPRTTRIVCLGGSTTYGTGLDYQDTYPAILQEKLDKNFGIGSFEVINAGEPGLNLPQIISLAKNEILLLEPDIIILMNINNNFTSPGFWFVDIKDPQHSEQKTGKPPNSSIINQLNKLQQFIVRHFALALLIQETISSGVYKYFMNFDWSAFSAALMAPDNIWQAEFSDNLNKIIKLFLDHNAHIKIILLAEAVNTVKFPEMEAPFNKANEIMKEKSKFYKGAYWLDTHSAIIDAARRGEKVWQTPSADPLHLKKEGNEIIADELAVYLPAYLNDGS